MIRFDRVCVASLFLAATAASAAAGPASLGCTGDAFSGNETCATALLVTSDFDVYYSTYGTNSNGTIYPEYFRVDVLPGQAFFVGAGWDLTQGSPIYLEVFEGTDCQVSVPLNGGGASSVNFSYTNLTTSTKTFIVSAYAGGCDDNAFGMTIEDLPAGTPHCFGDGSDTAFTAPMSCPCGNNSAPGDDEGCRNSTGRGARLEASGSRFVLSDDLLLTVTNARPNQVGVLIQGRPPASSPFRDGILCLATTNIRRLEFLPIDAAGSTQSTISFVTEGNVSAGDILHYQFWYRDPGFSACLTGANLSNAVRVVWI